MLTELLKKRKNKEQLTDEELAILKEYDESVEKKLKEEIEKKNKELEEVQTKFTSADSKLKETMASLEEIEKAKQELAKSKEELEKHIADAGSIEDIKIKLREDYEKKKEAEKLAEQIKYEEELKRLKEESNKQIEELKRQQEELAENTARLTFKTILEKDIVKRPYLEGMLKNLIEKVEKGEKLQLIKATYNLLVESVNHDTEMEKYKQSQSLGHSIFKTDVNDTTFQVDKRTNEEKAENEFSKWLKSNNNIK